MRPTDTSPEAQRLLDEHHRRMTPLERWRAVDQAWQTARALAFAGLRLDHPHATEAELEDLWAERRLGRELFAKVVAQRDRVRR
ncbi:MAG: hypothetical protein H6828_00020 [Planctomycetes bacterium]|nr:hypothetical protein [Planctomycetota bacterium]